MKRKGAIKRKGTMKRRRRRDLFFGGIVCNTWDK